MATLKTVNLEQLKREMKLIAGRIRPRQIILFEGPMGAGKTQAIQFLLEELGCSVANSPTFSIHQIYKTSSGEVDHFDLFRLKNENDLESSGFWECFDQASGLLLVEWADRLSGEWIPKGWDVIRIQLGLDSQNSHLRRFAVS